MVGLGYPFERLLRMTFSELRPWLNTAIERKKPKQTE